MSRGKGTNGFILLNALIVTGVIFLFPGNDEITVKPQVKLGAEVFLEKHIYLVKGKRVGLVTNSTGRTSRLESLIDIFSNHPEIELTALYGPEHGVRGNAQAGEYVPYYWDEKYEIPVFSLYGESLKPPSAMLADIDTYMRSFDTVDTGKKPEEEKIQNLDILIFDIQDVGTRIYTYIATMAYCLEACAKAGIEFIVLDRPNPINGVVMEGPVLKYPEYSSFVGLYPIPVRHGMTVGELALFFNQKYMTDKDKLTVIPMEGWGREMWYDDTALPWIIPSPNMPTLETAMVYPGQVFLEGTNISEGRGTTKPFELFGAPWIDGYDLSRKLNSLKLPGVYFREAWFTPTFSKYTSERCGGSQIHVIDRNLYRPFETTLHIIKTVKQMCPDQFEFHSHYFDKIMGTDNVRLALEQGRNIEEIKASYSKELERFKELRKSFLLY